MALRLQYRTSSGNWLECGADRTDEFLTMCEATTGMTRDAVLAALAAGETVRNDPDDWSSCCRCGATYDYRMAAKRASSTPVATVRCACGHTVPATQVMSASMGTSCPDCYDRMSGE